MSKVRVKFPNVVSLTLQQQYNLGNFQRHLFTTAISYTIYVYESYIYDTAPVSQKSTKIPFRPQSFRSIHATSSILTAGITGADLGEGPGGPGPPLFW